MDILRTSKETDLHDYVKEITEQGKVITPEQSVDKLINVLENRGFVSGEHVEYEDLK